jgi:cytochrome b561
VYEAAENAYPAIALPFLLVLLIVHNLAVVQHLVISKDCNLMRLVTRPHA